MKSAGQDETRYIRLSWTRESGDRISLDLANTVSNRRMMYDLSLGLRAVKFKDVSLLQQTQDKKKWEKML